ncbi:MAG TPA: alpha-amylase family glycosyl hydrolase [Bellilinea sp.]|nr:alpha-amylase family glycosyl hydrolase [Bellilinea sp.]
MPQPEWWKTGVIYQIYPRSFLDPSGDGIGDLRGITTKLGYLKDLGISAIWLSPIFPSPDVDFGYDTSEYTGIDPKFGTIADFDKLLAEAHNNGIRIILDLALNHTSDQHPWFQQSRLSKDSRYSDWYIWKNPAPGGKEPNNWQSVFGGSAWKYDEVRQQYYYHMFTPQQPDVNWRNPDVRKVMINVLRYWLNKGVDGFRLDVFNQFFKSANFEDNPGKLGLRGFDRQKHVYDTNQPEMIELVKEIRALMDEYPETYVVGETFLADQNMVKSYTEPGMLHAAFDFFLLNCKFQAKCYSDWITQMRDYVDKGYWPTTVLNNHDTKRSASRYEDNETDERSKVAATALLTLPGTPYMYYGEELGMRDIQLSRGQVKDPVGKMFWPFHKGRDGCRAPMQWNALGNAGFTGGSPWLPVNPDFSTRNVQVLAADEKSIFSVYKQLISLRKFFRAFSLGAFVTLKSPAGVIGYKRTFELQEFLVYLNFEKTASTIDLPRGIGNRHWKLMFSTKSTTYDEMIFSGVPIPGESALIFVLSE